MACVPDVHPADRVRAIRSNVTRAPKLSSERTMCQLPVPLVVCVSKAVSARRCPLLAMVVKLQDPENFLNPIIPGGFPDPSICRVGEVYYICNSSFEYFPGLPIHESTDLVNWSWVGYGLHRKDQVSGAVNLIDVKSEDGIQAPSLRYHDGMFYIITTCVYRPPGVDDGTCTNFIITAKDIQGPWSDPHVIEGAPGIDPDIFFDDDGKVWYVGTAAPDKPNYPGEGAAVHWVFYKT